MNDHLTVYVSKLKETEFHVELLDKWYLCHCCIKFSCTIVCMYWCYIIYRNLVSVQGNILYRFPSLQRTAASQRSGRKEYVGRRWSEWVGGVDKFFKEKKWDFRSYRFLHSFHILFGSSLLTCILMVQ